MQRKILFYLAFLVAFSFGFTSKANAQTELSAPSPTPASTPIESVLDAPGYVPGEPQYQKIRPSWAFGFKFGLNRFPIETAIGTKFSFFAEYILPFQNMGLFSIGPQFGLLPIEVANAGVPTGNYENISGGAILRYQLKVVENQWLVPTAALEWEYYRIKESDFNSTQLMGSDFGLSAGLMLNLGVFDSETARDGFQSIGLLRSYATVEIRTTNISNELFNLSGNYWLFGLRLEFE